jgi:hypothetical protein
MNNRTKTYLLLFLMVVAGFSKTNAQAITISTWLDTTVILLGDQIKYHVEVEQARDLQVHFPLYNDTIIDKIEILERTDSDTTFLSNKLIRINQEYLITSFDSGLYLIPPQPFWFNNNQYIDTLKSQALFLGVLTFQIDSIQGINDIKPPIDAPLTFKEVLPTVLYVLLGLTILLFAYILFKRTKRDGPKPLLVRTKPKQPAHFIALNSLDELKRKKLWQQGKHKAYQSELTDIVRTYIEDRYQVIAMEQTSEETIVELESGRLMSQELLEKLKKMLYTADLVKFAKMQLLADEHERSLTDAYDLVMKTKIKVDLSSEKDQENQSDQDQNENVQNN